MSDNNNISLSGVHEAPNIQETPDTYEIENQAADPRGLIEVAMSEIASWKSKIVLDLGAGTGFHIARFHETAAHVIAVEPHDASRLRIMQRVATLGLMRTSVMTGSAENIFLPDRSVDIVHARFAYFFAPHCEAGLHELLRVIRPGGTAFIIDNDLQTGTFASWVRLLPYWKDVDSNEIEQFWANHGFSLRRIASEWNFKSRANLESVVRIEFPGELADKIMSEHEGNRVDYHYSLYYRHY